MSLTLSRILPSIRKFVKKVAAQEDPCHLDTSQVYNIFASDVGNSKVNNYQEIENTFTYNIQTIWYIKKISTCKKISTKFYLVLSYELIKILLNFSYQFQIWHFRRFTCLIGIYFQYSSINGRVIITKKNFRNKSVLLMDLMQNRWTWHRKLPVILSSPSNF